MPKLSEDKQAQRRAHILDAAEICFAKAGFHRTTMQDICREAKVSAGAVYVYFDSKEALIDGIVGRDREEIMDHLAQVAVAPDFLKGLEQVLHSCLLDQPRHKSALFVEIAAEASRNAHVAAALSQCDRILRQTLGELLAKARAARQIPEGHDADTLSMVLALLGDALIFRRAVDPGFDAVRIAPVVMEMMAKLIGQRAGIAPVNGSDAAKNAATIRIA